MSFISRALGSSEIDRFIVCTTKISDRNLGTRRVPQWNKTKYIESHLAQRHLFPFIFRSRDSTAISVFHSRPDTSANSKLRNKTLKILITWLAINKHGHDLVRSGWCNEWDNEFNSIFAVFRLFFLFFISIHTFQSIWAPHSFSLFSHIFKNLSTIWYLGLTMLPFESFH